MAFITSVCAGGVGTVAALLSLILGFDLTAAGIAYVTTTLCVAAVAIACLARPTNPTVKAVGALTVPE